MYVSAAHSAGWGAPPPHRGTSLQLLFTLLLSRTPPHSLPFSSPTPFIQMPWKAFSPHHIAPFCFREADVRPHVRQPPQAHSPYDPPPVAVPPAGLSPLGWAGGVASRQLYRLRIFKPDGSTSPRQVGYTRVQDLVVGVEGQGFVVGGMAFYI